MYVAVVPNRSSPPAILLRESYRERGKVKNRTIANLSDWAPGKIEALRHVLRGGAAAEPLENAFEVVRSLPHGHVAAVVGTLRRLGVAQLIDRRRSRDRDLCEALVAGRLLELRSKLSTATALRHATAESTLGEVLHVQDSDEDELYEAMDWLLERQPRIERALAKRHLHDGTLVLYDLSSTYFEGRKCPLARRGHSRDKKSDKLQIVFGLLTDAEGCPVAVEVFEGNTGDPKTVAAQVHKLRERFGLKRVVLVGDRGMLTSARIREDVAPLGFEWITALRSPAIGRLVRSGSLQLSLFDQRDLAEIQSPDYPNERLIVCRNPLLAQERARKRTELLTATEKELTKLRDATMRPKRPLRGRAAIGLRAGRVLNRFKVAKHFQLDITDDRFDFKLREDRIAAEAALDGIYVIRTNVATEQSDSQNVVRKYKSLAVVERAFRSIKTVSLQVRPIHHRLADRVRAHLLICMLAYYVEWHMRRSLAPLLFHDEDRQLAEAERRSIVAKAPRSDTARAKDATKRTADGVPVQSFRDLLRDLSTVTRNRIQPAANLPAFEKVTTPTPLQQRAFSLLQVSPTQL